MGDDRGRVSVRAILRVPGLYRAASHLLDGAMKLAPIGNLQEQDGIWASIVVWALATAAFAQATYKLARREVTMRLIYAIVAFHGLNVIGRGIRPIEVVIWLVLSGIVVSNFGSAWDVKAVARPEDPEIRAF